MNIRLAAYERWSVMMNDVEENLVKKLVPSLESSTSPRHLFRAAIDACHENGGEDFGVQGDAFCASLISHNVLRALGRRSTYVVTVQLLFWWASW
jgi:hypothetical protein